MNHPTIRATILAVGNLYDGIGLDKCFTCVHCDIEHVFCKKQDVRCDVIWEDCPDWCGANDKKDIIAQIFKKTELLKKKGVPS